MIRILLILQTVFSILMLVHAIRRGREHIWWIIVMVPFGELVYFFAVYLDSPEYRAFKKRLFSRSARLQDLEHDARVSPSLHNKMQLASRYQDLDRFDDAIGLYQGVLKLDPDNADALYGLGACLSGKGDLPAAIKPLEQLVQQDMSYADFKPCEELARVYWESGKKEPAVELAERLNRKSQRLSHTTVLARYLSGIDRKSDARTLLEEALADYDSGPAYLRRSDRSWARQAKTLLRTL